MSTQAGAHTHTPNIRKGDFAAILTVSRHTYASAPTETVERWYVGRVNKTDRSGLVLEVCIGEPGKEHVEKCAQRGSRVTSCQTLPKTSVRGAEMLAAVGGREFDSLDDVRTAVIPFRIVKPTADTHFPNGTVDHGATVAS